MQGKFLRVLPLFTAVLISAAATAFANDEPAAGAEHNQARAVIEDLNRIVNPQGVQESFKTRIGGIDQWLYVRGQDRSNPIILFVHGGPASPLSPSMWQFQRPIEEYFTVVHWDQRAAGKTYLEVDPATISDSIRIDRYVSDAIEVAEYVNRRYGTKKVILMGHSWGTIVGLQAAVRRPDLFFAYVGIGQVISTRENERLSYEYAVAQARKAGNEAAIEELSSIAPYPGDQPITKERIIIARKWAQHYGGLSAFRSTSNYYFAAPLLSPEYGARDVEAISAGNGFTLERILPQFLEVDYTNVRKVAVPVIMFMGRHDYTTPTEPTQAWLSALSAPAKKAVWFENSAHMIPFEEPGKMLISLIEHVRPFAEAER